MSDSQGLRRARFLIERWVQRGILHQLCLMTGLVAVVALLGGIAAWTFTSDFESLPSAIWWSFLRLTDPGYLGDDEGAAKRLISSAVTVSGYVLFMGSLIAIMTQWLTHTLRKLESGLTPIAMENHFVILGWTNRTEEVIRKLLTAAGRLERFLARRAGGDQLRIVVLLDEVDSERRHEVREKLGAEWNESQVFLRSGSSLEKEHLQRLDLQRAAVVLIPGADFELGGAELNDARVIKTLLGLDALLRESEQAHGPYVVAELLDPKKVPILQSSTSTRTEIIAGNRLLSRLLSQSLRHPAGVGEILLGLMSHREGNGVYLRSYPELVGQPFHSLSMRFENALVLGTVSPGQDEPVVRLNPHAETKLEASDRLILIAETYADCESGEPASEPDRTPDPQELPPSPNRNKRRFLVLGWSHKVPTLIAELQESPTEHFEVTLMTRTGLEEREQLLAHLGESERVSIRHVVGDYSIQQDLSPLKPHEYDHVLLLASDWMESSEEADARTLMGLLVVRSVLAGQSKTPDILVELLNADNATLIRDNADVVFVSPRLLSHLLAHVGLLPELNAVFDELICSGGFEVTLRPPDHLGIDAREVSFREVQRAASSRSCIALGFYSPRSATSPREIDLNPDRSRKRTLGARDLIIVLARET